ncbi:MAG: hypothetical protein ACK4SA_12285, partial [Caldilinea sp.]
APVIGQRSGLCSALLRNLLEGQYAIKQATSLLMSNASGGCSLALLCNVVKAPVNPDCNMKKVY